MLLNNYVIALYIVKQYLNLDLVSGVAFITSLKPTCFFVPNKTFLGDALIFSFEVTSYVVVPEVPTVVNATCCT